MPIRINKILNYIQWGNQKKYYYKRNSLVSFKRALRKEIMQMRAIYANNYRKH
jgi:hypothetical protein